MFSILWQLALCVFYMLHAFLFAGIMLMLVTETKKSSRGSSFWHIEFNFKGLAFMDKYYLLITTDDNCLIWLTGFVYLFCLVCFYRWLSYGRSKINWSGIFCEWQGGPMSWFLRPYFLKISDQPLNHSKTMDNSKTKAVLVLIEYWLLLNTFICHRKSNDISRLLKNIYITY